MTEPKTTSSEGVPAAIHIDLLTGVGGTRLSLDLVERPRSPTPAFSPTLQSCASPAATCAKWYRSSSENPHGMMLLALRRTKANRNPWRRGLPGDWSGKALTGHGSCDPSPLVFPMPPHPRIKGRQGARMDEPTASASFGRCEEERPAAVYVHTCQRQDHVRDAGIPNGWAGEKRAVEAVGSFHVFPNWGLP